MIDLCKISGGLKYIVDRSTSENNVPRHLVLKIFTSEYRLSVFTGSFET